MDMAINNAVAGTLTEHVRTLDVSDAKGIGKQISKGFKDRGVKAVVRMVQQNIAAPLVAVSPRQGAGLRLPS